MSDKVARRLEEMFNKVVGYFDQHAAKTSSVDILASDNMVKEDLTSRLGSKCQS